MLRPDIDKVPAFYQRYVQHVKDLELIDALIGSSEETVTLVKSIPEHKGEYRYEPLKWSIKELLVHMMDAERVFAYRALRFSRNDKTPLPGFEENDYAPRANAHNRSLLQIADEMKRLRITTVDLFKSFSTEMLDRLGTASNVNLSVLMIGYIIAGHECHHRKVLTERYIPTL